ncbi:restriction endonuclease subunit S [Bacteroides stercoris]|uniref:restriction endonuclease subunit S n=1 Tax=Bacteroides stercoris TaxID=46506 RepID=UPI00359CB347
MKLFDIIEVFIAGDWGEETYSKETPCAVTCVRGADIIPISEYDFSAIPVRYISQQAYAKKCLQVGDIIIEKSGGSPTQSTGRVSLVSQELLDHAGAVICSNFCTAFRVKKGWNPLHVYYYLQFIYNLGAFFNFEGKTSGIKNLQLDAAFAAIPTEDISESIQNNIVVILQGLEKKIAINRQINQNLEAMAKQLYDYWFVQFDYPDENGKPYKSSGGKMVWNEKLKREIPVDWEVLPLFDAVSVQYGFPFATEQFTEEETNVPVVRIRDILAGTTSAYSLEKADEKFHLNENDVLVGMDGNFHMNFWHDNIAYLNQRCVRLRAHSDSTISSIQILHSIKPYIKAKEQNAKGSTVGHLSDKDLKGLYLIKPLKTRAFNPRKTLDGLLALVIENKKQILSLTKQRDELLPLLMNCQVSVNSDLADD